MKRACLLLALCGVLATAFATDVPVAPKPLFRDPVFDGAADPVVIWNPTAQRWWMFYTNRRANVPGLSGVAWVHGTKVGLAESADGGATWTHLGPAQIELPPEIGGTEPTHWAPDVVTGLDGLHHMFLTVVPGVFEDWQHPRRIVHLTSTDLRQWKYESALALASDRVIDAGVVRRPDGGWRMWYNNERDGKSIYYADSPDLHTWTDRGKAAGVGERPGEGPFVFRWKDAWWMLVDLWKGLGVYRSTDLLTWTAQAENLLAEPGTGADDGVNGGHPAVVVSHDRAYLFYFTHPGRARSTSSGQAGTISPDDKNNLELRRSSIQLAELTEKDGRLSCDRNAPVTPDLRPVTPFQVVDTAREPVAPGPFAPTWESLAQYETPEWFRDAKFGIWAHWGPQCEPGRNDWYARYLYMQNPPPWATGAYEFHVQKYGHPSKNGFKDVIHRWKAENWDPDKLVALYARAGAQYFFALANHHDNLDLWDSKYQPWNSVRVGPKKDLIAGWEKAARAHGLKFGVSVHAAHAWTWYETAQGADTKGPLAGVPYDGKLTKADGRGTWWEGLDPQDLYAQNHPRSARADDPVAIHRQWDWDNGASLPDAAYTEKFYNRTVDLINRTNPDLLYFDDTALPLWPVSDAGLKIAAHYYNRSAAQQGGRADNVIFGKILTAEQKSALVWDVERGAPNHIEEQPWQTCTCIGNWHYDDALYAKRGYKSAATVIHMLADVVSKNGNLLLSIPVRGDGTIDDLGLAVVEDIAAWMAVNREAIFATRPWQIFGEGPALEHTVPLTEQGFNEGRGKPFTADDVRFTRSKDGRTLYVISLGRPTGPLTLKSLGTDAGRLAGKIAAITQLGASAPPAWNRAAAALVITPAAVTGDTPATVFKLTFE